MERIKMASTAYVPRELFQFAGDIYHWTYDEEIMASPPEFFRSYTGKIYVRVGFGHSPVCSAVCSWASLEDGDIYWWDEEGEDWNHNLSAEENFAATEALVFEDVSALETYICTGEI